MSPNHSTHCFLTSLNVIRSSKEQGCASWAHYGENNITELLLNKYETLYNSVQTSDIELSSIKDVVYEGIINHQLHGILITPDIISDCVKQLNKGKDDGNHGFKSDHLIQGGHRLYTYLSILFNAMIWHGYNPRELLLSSIIYIPKDIKYSLRDSNNYRGISLFNAICKVYDNAIIFLCYNKFITSDMQFGLKRIIQL